MERTTITNSSDKWLRVVQPNRGCRPQTPDALCNSATANTHTYIPPGGSLEVIAPFRTEEVIDD
jgi:hypothetical protein